MQTVAVGVIKATTPKEAAGVTTKAAQKVIFFPVLWIRIRIGSVFNWVWDPDPYSESGSRRAKMTHKSRQ
jgi:hypothetical protein